MRVTDARLRADAKCESRKSRRVFVALTTRERRREGEERESGRGVVPLCACWSGGVFKRPKDGMKEGEEQIQRWDRKRRTVHVFAVRVEDDDHGC